MKLRDNDNELVENELNEIENEKNSSVKKTRWIDMFKIRKLRQALLVTVVIQMSQQLTGNISFENFTLNDFICSCNIFIYIQLFTIYYFLNLQLQWWKSEFISNLKNFDLNAKETKNVTVNILLISPLIKSVYLTF